MIITNTTRNAETSHNITRNNFTQAQVINLTTFSSQSNNQNQNQNPNPNPNQNTLNLNPQQIQNQRTQNTNLNLEISKMNENNPFPIQHSETDRKYEDILKSTNAKINKSLSSIKKETPPINLPLLNTTQNVLTSISRTLRFYILMMSEFLPNLTRLSELMEREQFIPNINDRKNANDY